MTSLIEARAVSKRFRQHKRFPGFLGAIKTLVTAEYTEVTAVEDVSFSIRAGEAVGYLGAGVPVYGPVTQRNSTWYSPEAPSYPHDPARARRRTLVGEPTGGGWPVERMVHAWPPA